MMQSFKRYSAAQEFAGEAGAILTIGQGGDRLYVAVSGTEIEVRMATITLAKSSGKQVGFVTFDHFDRLGNACHAEGDPKWAFPDTLRAPPADETLETLNHTAQVLEEVRAGSIAPDGPETANALAQLEEVIADAES